MPCFNFQCKDCDLVYEALAKFDEYKKVKCPVCQSKKKEKLINSCLAIVFKDPNGSSKEDSFNYKAGWNMEMAKKTRMIAEEKSHMGRKPYNDVPELRKMNSVV